MDKVDIEKFLFSLIEQDHEKLSSSDLSSALKAQGLECKDGQISEISATSSGIMKHKSEMDSELTEFEMEFANLCDHYHICRNDATIGKTIDPVEFSKSYAPRLLSIAYKQFAKDLPRWYKTDVESLTIAGGMLFYKGYKIDISELEILPKED